MKKESKKEGHDEATLENNKIIKLQLFDFCMRSASSSAFNYLFCTGAECEPRINYENLEYILKNSTFKIFQALHDLVLCSRLE